MKPEADTPWPAALHGRFGIVTGAASGIGRAAALHLAQMGAGVAMVDLDSDGLAETQARIGETTPRGRAVVFEADASDEAQVLRVVEETATAFGAIDFLVNCAGILRRTAFADITVEEWDLMMKVNLRGPFLYCRSVAERMLRSGGGTIVNVASLAGRTASILGGAHYTAAKHAIVGLSRHMARELGPSGVRVNAFCPGATLTPMITRCTPDSEIEAVAAAIPRRRWADPAEQAAVIGFLVSDLSANITGACIDSNGGSLMI